MLFFLNQIRGSEVWCRMSTVVDILCAIHVFDITDSGKFTLYLFVSPDTWLCIPIYGAFPVRFASATIDNVPTDRTHNRMGFPSHLTESG